MWKQVFVLIVVVSTLASVKTVTAQNISIALSATDLSGCDVTSKCDAYIITRCSSFDSDWKECGRTKSIHNDNNPNWSDAFEYLYQPNKGQRWRMSLWDSNVVGDNLISLFPIILVEEFIEKKEIISLKTADNRGTLHVEMVR